MTTEVSVVTPDDLGVTLKLNTLVPNKIDVDVAALTLPDPITGMSLTNTVLTVLTLYGNETIDLAPMLPTVIAEVFLKGVVRRGDELVFTVGGESDTTNDTELTVTVADLLPVVSDGVTVLGDGTASDKLRLDMEAAETKVKAWSLEANKRTIKLTNASDTRILGYIHESAE